MKSRSAQALAFGFAFLVATAAARATVTEFKATLTGDAESSSTATGKATVVYDSVAHTLHVDVSFSGLVAPDIASHIHAATSAPLTGKAGVATTVPTFPGFPLGVMAGTYDHILDLTSLASFNPAYVAAHGGTAASAESSLVAAMFADESYVNVHSKEFPGGEIDGFLVATPDGGSTALLLTGGVLALLGLARARRRVAA